MSNNSASEYSTRNFPWVRRPLAMAITPSLARTVSGSSLRQISTQATRFDSAFVSDSGSDGSCTPVARASSSLSLLNELLLGCIGEAAHRRHLTGLFRVIRKVEMSLPLGQVFEVLKLLLWDWLGAPVAGRTFDAAVQLHCSIHVRWYSRLLDFLRVAKRNSKV